MARSTKKVETIPVVYLLLLDTPVQGIPLGVYRTVGEALADAVKMGLPQTVDDLNDGSPFPELRQRYLESSYEWIDCGFKANRRICGYTIELFEGGKKTDHQALEPYNRLSPARTESDHTNRPLGVEEDQELNI